MTTEEIKAEIESYQTSLGIEFGSTRIKAVLINSKFEPVAGGSFEWENQLVNGVWTYDLDLIHKGLQTCYKDLKKDVKEKYGVTLKSFKAFGVSAMMHGYLAFDKDDNLLVPFRTWRNTITGQASKELSEKFNFPVPERWSISHLYQAILNKEPHVSSIKNVYTLAGYIHYMLTGEKVLGVGDASGMFPIDRNTGNYKAEYAATFKEMTGFDVSEVFPKVLPAGAAAGNLTEKGAAFLDPDGDLVPGVPMCPPEGDAGTGMAATNSVRVKTGNISAGTSIFSMVVLDKDLKKTYPGLIDIVTTPDGIPVAMVHCNNCTGENNYWINLFDEVVQTMGFSASKGELFDKLIGKSLEADKDVGGLLSYNYLSGETITGFNSGRPLFVRSENCNFTLANFMRSLMFTALGANRKGMDILFDENVSIDSMFGAGGYFKTEAGLKYMAASIHTPVSAMETAGEGGPWGMAILASFMADNKGKVLPDFLDSEVFGSCKKTTAEAEPELVESFNIFYERYLKGLAVEKAAVENL